MGTAALLLLPPPRGGGGGAGRELLLPDGAVRAVVVVFCGASRSQGSRPPTFSLDAAIDVEGGSRRGGVYDRPGDCEGKR
jgi:hypothetical protein